MSEQRRKVIIKDAPSKRFASSDVTVLPPVDGLLADALNIISAELNRYNYKVKQGKSLDLSEARVVQGYLKSLVEISRESRERDKQDDLSELSTEEMIELLKKSKPKGEKKDE